MENKPSFEILPWDSDFFGRKIARATVHRLDPEVAHGLVDGCLASGVECLYFLADADHAETARLAQDHDFRLVDIRVTLRRDVPSGPEAEQEGAIRLSRPSDVHALEAIARSSHTDSRFYFDGGFPVDNCAALYQTWIRRSCEGYADAVFVAELDGQPVGYLSAHLKASRGEIGLVGIAAGARGRSLGSALVKHSLRWFGKRGMKDVSVVTQGRNAAAQRLYQRCGFVTDSIRIWYHRWFHKQP